MAETEVFPKRERISLYRNHAEDARRFAALAPTPELRADYLRLAEEWEKLADDLEQWR